MRAATRASSSAGPGEAGAFTFEGPTDAELKRLSGVYRLSTLRSQELGIGASAAPEQQTFYDGWANYHRLLLDALRDLTADQLLLKPSPTMWAVWQLASHMAASRTYWFHDVLGEGDAALRDLFRVESTTVPDLAVEDATWEDDEDHPRGPAEIVEALERSWAMIEDCLERRTPDDLAVEFSHDLHHGGEISLILGSHGLAGLDL